VSAHSPGPWRWDGDGLHLADADDGKRQPVTNWRDPPSSTSHVLCLCEDHGMKPTQADAVLIAAAPELLDALTTDHRNHCDEWNGRYSPRPCPVCALIARFERRPEAER
jgi:hypothetical protein